MYGEHMCRAGLFPFSFLYFLCFARNVADSDWMAVKRMTTKNEIADDGCANDTPSGDKNRHHDERDGGKDHMLHTK